MIRTEVDAATSRGTSNSSEESQETELLKGHENTENDNFTARNSSRRTSRRNGKSTLEATELAFSKSGNQRKKNEVAGGINSTSTDSVNLPTQNTRAMEEDKPKHSINAYATMLSRLDQRAYARALLRDADQLVENVLQPMSLPWALKVPPVARNIPCDIDEMVEVLTMDDGTFSPFDVKTAGNFGFGQYENGQFRTGKGATCLTMVSDLEPSATRRSIDPGVIELSSVSLPIYSLEGPTSKQDIHDVSRDLGICPGSVGDSVKDGEVQLRCFEINQAIKKRKILQSRKGVRKTEVSVRINSCSSRTSILDKVENDDDGDDNATLPRHLLEATLPLEVTNGTTVSKSKAKAMAAELGTYDLRYGLSDNAGTGTGATRLKAGRTRLMWSQQETTGPPRGGSTYSHTLTGEKLDNGQHKRPRRLVIQLKVDGHVFRDLLDTNDSNSISEPIDDDEKPEHSDSLQATLDCEKYVQTLLSRECIEQPESDRPSIECIPASCGTIHVLCTKPGQMQPRDVDLHLSISSNDGREILGNLCTVCQQPSSGVSLVEACAGCGLLAHPTCCLDKGQTIPLHTTEISSEGGNGPSYEWMCASCCTKTNSVGISVESPQPQKRSKRAPKPSNKLLESQVKLSSFNQPTKHVCGACGHFGGAMSQINVNGQSVWIHEVCRIWTNGRIFDIGTSSQDMGGQQCIICERPTENIFGRCTVKCAANNCHIYVHPMCAMLSSIPSQSVSLDMNKGEGEHEKLELAKQNDIRLCCQYTLSFAKVRKLSDTAVRRSTLDIDDHSTAVGDGTVEETLPVVFCPIHNPKRERSFYGLLPGGLPAGTLRIPPSREPS